MSTRGAVILVVDDELEIRRALQRALKAHGYSVLTASSGEEAVELLAKQRPDLVLLDLLLPGMSGLEVCRQVRAASNVPIIVLSVKDAEGDKVEALDLGADDYVSKPFGMNEVLARIRVALRRAIQPLSGPEPRFQIGPLSIDFAKREVLVEGRGEVRLTPTEFDLLKAFITHRGKILTRQMLLQAVWGAGAQARAHSLHVYVALLRQKIEPLPERPHFIETIPGGAIVSWRRTNSRSAQGRYDHLEHCLHRAGGTGAVPGGPEWEGTPAHLPAGACGGRRASLARLNDRVHTKATTKS